MKQLRILAVTVVVLIGVLAVGCTPKPTQRTAMDEGAMANKAVSKSSNAKKVEASPQEVAEAVVWGNKYVLPALEAGRNDQLPGVARLMRKLYGLAADKKVQITMAAAPGGPGLAWTVWSQELGKPRIYLGVPELRDLQVRLSPKQFSDMVLAVLCHETIHLEERMPSQNEPKGSSPEGRAMALDEEAKAWACTVVEVTCPLQRAGRYVSPQALAANKALGEAGGKDCPQWREWVKDHLVK